MQPKETRLDVKSGLWRRLGTGTYNLETSCHEQKAL